MSKNNISQSDMSYVKKERQYWGIFTPVTAHLSVNSGVLLLVWGLTVVLFQGQGVSALHVEE